MHQTKRVFIFGAGFSRPAGMPLATDLMPLLKDKIKLDEMADWLEGMRERLAWLSNNDQHLGSFKLNIEEVFHYGRFDIEAHRLKQHCAPVGRWDGDTPWSDSQSIDAWLSYLEEALRDVILDFDDRSDLAPIRRWAHLAGPEDAVLTFNYDTLVERGLTLEGKKWIHGTRSDIDAGIPVFKLHGSIDWIVAHRAESFSKLEMLFDKKNSNQSDGKTGHIEDDCRLWRCRTRDQLRDWIEGRMLQMTAENACPRQVGIAGLGPYKPLHHVPGLGCIWFHGMSALYHADLAIVVGFSMSDFDTMAQMQFAEVARARISENNPLRVVVIDPVADDATISRFNRVFRTVEFVKKRHEELDWSAITA